MPHLDLELDLRPPPFKAKASLRIAVGKSVTIEGKNVFLRLPFYAPLGSIKPHPQSYGEQSRKENDFLKELCTLGETISDNEFQVLSGIKVTATHLKGFAYITSYFVHIEKGGIELPDTIDLKRLTLSRYPYINGLSQALNQTIEGLYHHIGDLLFSLKQNHSIELPVDVALFNENMKAPNHPLVLFHGNELLSGPVILGEHNPEDEILAKRIPMEKHYPESKDSLDDWALIDHELSNLYKGRGF